MRQPIKFLPYLKSTEMGGEEISRFKNININCKNIGESWELSAVPGCESIVMDGEECGMTLTDLVRKYKHDLVGESVYGRYGDKFPIFVKFIDSEGDFSLQVHPDCNHQDAPVCYSYYPGDDPTHREGSEGLMTCDYFKVTREVIDGEKRITKTDDSFMGMVCVGGSGSVKVDGISTPVRQGETLLLPAKTDEFEVEGVLSLLTVVIPTLMKAELSGMA